MAVMLASACSTIGHVIVYPDTGWSVNGVAVCFDA
jgi:hypothetical protein